ncbi:MAG: hypothetical protein AAF750_08060 [Planctomycetota bacterium]
MHQRFPWIGVFGLVASLSGVHTALGQTIETLVTIQDPDLADVIDFTPSTLFDPRIDGDFFSFQAIGPGDDTYIRGDITTGQLEPVLSIGDTVPGTDEPIAGTIAGQVEGPRFVGFGITNPLVGERVSGYFGSTGPGEAFQAFSEQGGGLSVGIIFSVDGNQAVFGVNDLDAGTTRIISADLTTPFTQTELITSATTVLGLDGEPLAQTAISLGSADAGFVVFNAIGEFSSEAIVLRTPEGALEQIATTGFLPPGDSGPEFVSLSVPVTADGDVAFLGLEFGESDDSLFVSIDGTLIEIADADTTLPGQVGDLVGIGGMSNPAFTPGLAIDDGRVVFTAFDDENEFLVLWDEINGLQVLLQTGDLIDGETVLDILVDPRGLSGDRIVFSAATGTFEDPNIGVFLVTIPEPASALVLSILCTTVLTRRRYTAR